MPAMVEERLLKSRYRLVEEIGRGGMAVVYRGEDVELGREVAVKILHDFLADKQEARQRFHREARVVARLQHDNILEIFDYSGLDSDRNFIVTEYIRGTDLASFLKEHPIRVPEVALMILAELCGAVIHAHEQGIIHRDIKPENVMVREDGLLKLMDFGIAQMVDTQKLTLTGQLLGSPAYMAPEMVTGGEVDYRTDVFSLGVLLYRLATGQLPFTGRNPHEVLKRIAEGEHTPASMVCPAVSPEMDAIIEKALSVSPRQRYQSARELAEDIRHILADLGIEDPRRELRLFFADPEGYQDDLSGRLVGKLLQEAREELASRRLPAAMRTLNRVLCLDPHNEEVPKLVRQVRRRQALADLLRTAAHGALAVAVVVTTVLAVWGLGKIWRSGHTRDAGQPTKNLPASFRRAHRASRGEPDAGHETSGLPSSRPDVSTPPSRSTPSPPRSRRGGPQRLAIPPTVSKPRRTRPHRPTRAEPTKSPQKRIFRLLPYPPAVRVSIDGGPSREFGPDLQTITLGPGEHTIRFTSPFCYAETVRIPADKPGGVIRARLKWRPARLVVRTNVDADVQVGNIVGLAGRPILVPIPPSSRDGRRKVLVKVSASGYHTAQQSVVVEANRKKTLDVRLKPL